MNRIRWIGAALTMFGCLAVATADDTQTVTKETSTFRTVANYKVGTKTLHGPYAQIWVESGQPHLRGQYDEGAKVGTWTTHRKNGHLSFKKVYVDGKLHGPFVQYSEKYAAPLSTKVIDPAVPVATTTYVNGKQHGTRKEWLSNGTQQFEAEYRFDLRHGPAKAWFLSGTQSWIGQYLFGMKHGTFRYFKPNGEFKETKTFVLDEDAASPAGPSAGEKLLLDAVSFAGTHYAGWSYGSSARKKQVDCTQFINAWLKGRVDPSKHDTLRRAILMTDLGALPIADLDELVRSEDPRTMGVRRALEVTGAGTAVAIENAAPGDLVQYWYYTGGRYLGHAGVLISAPKKDKRGQYVADIFGSHKSRSGIGIVRSARMTTPSADASKRRKSYFGRLK